MATRFSQDLYVVYGKMAGCDKTAEIKLLADKEKEEEKEEGGGGGRGEWGGNGQLRKASEASESGGVFPEVQRPRSFDSAAFTAGNVRGRSQNPRPLHPPISVFVTEVLFGIWNYSSRKNTRSELRLVVRILDAFCTP